MFGWVDSLFRTLLVVACASQTLATPTLRLETPARSVETIAGYRLTHDENGNPLSRTVTDGLPGFVADDRVFTVDRLNRLTGTEYFENGQVESTMLDLVGNRESHTDRAGTVTVYGTMNPANEYQTIGGSAVIYDEAGNLTVDSDGRQYAYDEQSHLIQIKAADDTVLANYTYDALGRRIAFEDPVAGVTTRYYYDGHSIIEGRGRALRHFPRGRWQRRRLDCAGCEGQLCRGFREHRRHHRPGRQARFGADAAIPVGVEQCVSSGYLTANR